MLPALSERRTLRLVVLSTLYLAQGIPFGFATVTLITWLTARGVDAEGIASIGALAMLPWAMKWAWGPIVDAVRLPGGGRRRPWIIFAQAVMACSLLHLALLDDLDQRLSMLAWTFFVHNVFNALQDVAVDALAVDLLPEDERGVANGLMYACKWGGTALGGAGLGWVMVQSSLQVAAGVQFAILIAIMFVPLLVRERPTDRSGWRGRRAAPAPAPPPSSPSQSESQSQRQPQPQPQPQPREDAPASPAAGVDFGTQLIGPPPIDERPAGTAEPVSILALVRDLVRAFSIRASILSAFLAGTLALGSGTMGVLGPRLALEQYGLTTEQWTAWSGGVAVIAGAVGSLLGGWLADRLGPRTVGVAAGLLLGSSWVALGVGVQVNAQHTWVPLGVALVDGFFGGMMTVAFFTMYMKVSWPRVAASQFTAYMALQSVAVANGYRITPWLEAQFGTGLALVAVAGCLVLSLSIVPFIDPGETRRRLGDGTPGSTPIPPRSPE